MKNVTRKTQITARAQLIPVHLFHRKTAIRPRDFLSNISGIDVGGGWRTGCGSHPQSAERVEELEDSVWSVVRQENEREGQTQREGVQDGGKTSTDVRGRDMGVEEGTGKEIGGCRLLRWMCGVMKLDKIRNERIRRTTKVRKSQRKYRKEG